MIIGITGGSGCGKTTLLKLIEELGGTVLDCDAIYYGLLKTDKALLEAIDRRFPGTVENGMLDRKKLGSIVFADEEALADLNGITHAAVKAEVIRRLAQTPEDGCPYDGKSRLAAIDAFALVEGGLAELCKLTVAVTAPVEDRVRRLTARDGITEAYARARIAAQRPQEEFVALCDHHLENNGTEAQFREKCLAFLAGLGIIKA